MNTNRQNKPGKSRIRGEYQAESGPGPGEGGGSQCVQGGNRAKCPGESSEKSSGKLLKAVQAQSGRFERSTSDTLGLGRAIGKGDRGNGACPGRKRRGRKPNQGECGNVGGFLGGFQSGKIRKAIQETVEDISRQLFREAYGGYQAPASRATRKRRFFGGGNPDGDGGLLECAGFLEGKPFTRDGGLLESKVFVQVDFPGETGRTAAAQDGRATRGQTTRKQGFCSSELHRASRSTRKWGIFGGLESRGEKRNLKKQAGSWKPGTKVTEKGGHGSRNEHYVNYDKAPIINHLRAFPKRDCQGRIMPDNQGEREYTLRLFPGPLSQTGKQPSFFRDAWEKTALKGIISRVAIGSQARRQETGRETKA